MITVLYVDDEAETEKMASKFEIMRKMDIEVITVARVPKVMKKLEEVQDKINLLVLDIIMPPEEEYSVEDTSGGISTGLRLLQDIRSKYKTLPILIVSIRGVREFDNIKKVYNVAGILEKPVSAYHVAIAIKGIVSSSASK